MRQKEDEEIQVHEVRKENVLKIGNEKRKENGIKKETKKKLDQKREWDKKRIRKENQKLLVL